MMNSKTSQSQNDCFADGNELLSFVHSFILYDPLSRFGEIGVNPKMMHPREITGEFPSLQTTETMLFATIRDRLSGATKW
jgi:hypothetical protein